jgi:DNA-binding transcriptional regulator YiaG
MLKMKETDAPELPEVEYLCNQIGKTLEIPVADFYIIKFGEDSAIEKVFVTKIFIKRGTLSDLQGIHHFRNNDEHTCEDLIRIITEKIKRPYDVNVFIQTVLFDALIGNHDRHGKNLAFLVTPGQMSLSPIYNNVSYLGLEKGEMLLADFNPTGKIATTTTFEPSMRDYAKELKRLGHKDQVEAFYKRIKLTQINKLINESFCSELMKTAISTLIPSRSNPAYKDYCISQGISPNEKNLIVLLGTIGKRGPSSFIYVTAYKQNEFSIKNVTLFRKKLQLTQHDFAQALDISMSNLQKAETNKRSDKHSLKILQIFFEFPEVAIWQLRQTGGRVKGEVLSKLITYFESRKTL